MRHAAPTERNVRESPGPVRVELRAPPNRQDLGGRLRAAALGRALQRRGQPVRKRRD